MGGKKGVFSRWWRWPILLAWLPVIPAARAQEPARCLRCWQRLELSETRNLPSPWPADAPELRLRWFGAPLPVDAAPGRVWPTLRLSERPWDASWDADRRFSLVPGQFTVGNGPQGSFEAPVQIAPLTTGGLGGRGLELPASPSISLPSYSGWTSSGFGF